MNSVVMQMQNQLCKSNQLCALRDFILYIASMRMAGAISKSTDVMKAMNNLVKIPEIRDAMMELSREMTKVIFLCVIII